MAGRPLIGRDLLLGNGRVTNHQRVSTNRAMDTRPDYPSPEHLARIPSSWREPSHVSSQGKEAASVTHDIYMDILENYYSMPTDILSDYISVHILQYIQYIYSSTRYSLIFLNRSITYDFLFCYRGKLTSWLHRLPGSC